jgi:pimeloyl-ACP methyl ester carboxylesterase
METPIMKIAPLIAVVVLVATATIAQAEEGTMPLKTSAADKTGYVKAGGTDYYYEIRGSGEPLLLLHGGLGSTAMFAPILPALGAGRTVIGIDHLGHGHTALGQRKIDLAAIGDDMATILTALGYAQVDVLGYSFGGNVAFRLAVQHPEMVRRLVLVSAGYAMDGFYPDMRVQQKQVGAAMAEGMKDTPMYKSYVAEAPKPEDFPRLLDAMGDYMRGEFDWSADVAKLTMPTMIAFGDSDMYRPEHIVKFYQLLGGGLRDAGWMRENLPKNRLAIIPNRTHYDVFFAPELVGAVRPFLDGITQVPTWDNLVGKSP